MKTFARNNMGARRDVCAASRNRVVIERARKWMSGLATMVSLAVVASASAQTLPYSEDFTTTTYRDGTETTADWAGTGQVLLPTASTLINPFTETTTVEVLPGDFNTRDVELADLDNDGDLDLIEGIFGPNGVYLNDGTGNFGVGRAYSDPSGSNTRDITTGDVDRDGDIDFVAANAFSRIRLYLNDGTGTSFEVQDVSIQGGVETQSVELVDLDGDGFLDVVAANLDFEQNRVFWNTGDPLTPFGIGGQAGLQLDSSIEEESRRVVTGDLDNDGDIDLVFFNESEVNPNTGLQQRNRVYMNELAQGNPRGFSHSEIEMPASDDIDTSHGGALGDLNGDGFLDLVVVNFIPGEESKIYLNNASGAANVNPFTVPGTIFTSPGNPDFAQNAKLADADHDGDLDIYLIISGHSFRNRVYFNDGTGTITGFVDVGPVGQAPLVLGDPADVGAVSNDGALGDVDGDGDLDWVLANQETKPSNGPMENILLRSAGLLDETTARQLQARATSLQVDNVVVSGASSVRLNPAPLGTSVGPQFHTGIEYWVSGNGGANWTPIGADGRPVPIVAGNDVRWRAVFRANSPANAATFALNQLSIERNSNPPVLGTPIDDPLLVTEGVDIGDAAIFADFTDADGDTLYYSISGLPVGTGIGINPKTGQLIGTPTNADTLAQPIGPVTVTATDGAFTATDVIAQIQVTNTNNAPEFTSLPPGLDVGPPPTSAATQDVLYTYSITATDSDPGDTLTLTISATELPSWLTLVDNGGGSATLSGTPTAADVLVPDQVVALVVTDSGLATDTQTFEMVIENTNDAPSFTSIPNLYGVAGSPYAYDVTTEDPDADAVTITAPTLPAWLGLVDNADGTASLSGTPGIGDIGVHAVSLQVSDGELSVTQNFNITVVDGEVDTDSDGLVNSVDLDDDNDGLLDQFDPWPLGRFNDVDPATHFAFSFIETLERSGITGGCGGGNYCPDDPVTRAQMAVFLERGINGSDFVPPPATGEVFADVGANDFAAAYIERLFADGITGGCGGGNYCPTNSVTRAQMAVFLLRAKYGASFTPPPATGVFSDVPVGSFADAYIEQLAAEGITGGCGNGNYCPNDPITRAQMAVFLVRTFGL